jgi:hypothetical protein
MDKKFQIVIISYFERAKKSISKDINMNITINVT